MIDLPDPDWYLDNVLVFAEPGVYSPAAPGPVRRWRDWWTDQSAASEPWQSASGRQGFVLRTDQLAGFGVSRQRARTLVRRGVWAVPAYGMVAPIDVRDDDAYVAERRRHALTAAARAARRPGSVVSGRSAAVLHGLPTFAVPEQPELTAPKSVRSGVRTPAHIYEAGLPDDDVTTWYGTPVTTVARTLVDLGRHSRRDAIMAGDVALRERLVDHPEIAAALTRAVGWPGVRAARGVLRLLSPLAESPLESLVRLVLHDDGFPPPELQVRIAGYRVDMVFRARRLILEIDGLAKYTDAEVRREKRRAQRLRALGYRVERITWDDAVGHWPETRAWLGPALRLPGRAG